MTLGFMRDVFGVDGHAVEREPTDLNHSDALTKELPAPKLVKHMAAWGLEAVNHLRFYVPSFVLVGGPNVYVTAALAVQGTAVSVVHAVARCPRRAARFAEEHPEAFQIFVKCLVRAARRWRPEAETSRVSPAAMHALIADRDQQFLQHAM